MRRPRRTRNSFALSQSEKKSLRHTCSEKRINLKTSQTFSALKIVRHTKVLFKGDDIIVDRLTAI